MHRVGFVWSITRRGYANLALMSLSLNTWCRFESGMPRATRVHSAGSEASLLQTEIVSGNDLQDAEELCCQESVISIFGVVVV